MSLRRSVFGKIYNNQEFNTYITGVTPVANTANELSSMLLISESSISNFEIDGNTVKALITESFDIYEQNINNLGRHNLVRYVDNGAVLTIGESYQKGIAFNLDAVQELIFPFAKTMYARTDGIGYEWVTYEGTFRKLYIPEVENIVGYVDFNKAAVVHPECRFYLNPLVENNNSLNNWRDKGVKCLFVRSYDEPKEINSSNILDIQSFGFKVGNLSNGNDVDTFELYNENDQFIGIYDGYKFLTGLEKNTTYSYKIKVRDSNNYYTGISDLISFTTTDTNFITRGIVAHFNLDNNLDDLIQGIKINNSKSCEFVSGKLNQGLHTYSNKFFLPVAGVKAISFWVKIDAWLNGSPWSYLLDLRNAYNGYIFRTGSSAIARMFVDGVQSSKRADVIPIDSNFHHVYIETNSTIQSGSISMGSANNQDYAGIDAVFDNITTYSEYLTNQEISDLADENNMEL